MKKYILLAIFCLFIVGLYSANYQQDSLTVESSDSETIKKIREYLDLSEKNRNRNNVLAVEYAQKALILSQQIDDIELLYQSEFALGYANYSCNDYEKAIEHFSRSLDISKKSNNRSGEAASLNRIGNTLQLMGKYQEAMSNYEQALIINRELDNTIEIARTLTNLGSIFRLYGNYEKAINLHLEALELYEGVNNNEGIAWSALNIARLFRMMKNYTKAFEYVNQSLEIYQKIAFELENNTGVTLCLKETGDIYFEKGEFEKAIEYSEQVLQINKQSQNWQGYSNSLSTLGKIYFQQSDFGESSKYFSEALQIKDSLNDNTEKASILRHLGLIALREGKTQEAEKRLKNSLEFAQKQNLKEDIKESFFALSGFYEKQKNVSVALTYFKLYINLKDSLNNQKINELELQYGFDKEQRIKEFEQHQKDLEQKAKLQRQKILTWVFIAGFVFMILLAYIIFKNLQRKKRTNLLLVQQKTEIENQRDEIEAQRDFVTKQRDQIAQQNTIITDSIEYAKRIQTALLPQDKYMKAILGDYFVYMKPKNIVSGDFYWVSEKNDKIIVAVSDCTGHGVPGAFMSMLGVAFLNEIVNKSDGFEANQILSQLRSSIIESLHQEYGFMGSKDGMDMALCIIDKKTLNLQFAGAYNPCVIIRNHEIVELLPDKMPIGIHAIKVDKDFTNKEFQLLKGDVVYLFTDGYIDQFGGKDGLKYRQKPFKQLLLSISSKNMKKQGELLKETMDEWQGERSQLDDMMIMGIKF
jgi:serine phosphatase RsbU (regulator of sigma subunit)/Flp pilus assembly protein TadD